MGSKLNVVLPDSVLHQMKDHRPEDLSACCVPGGSGITGRSHVGAGVNVVNLPNTRGRMCTGVMDSDSTVQLLAGPEGSAELLEHRLGLASLSWP